MPAQGFRQRKTLSGYKLPSGRVANFILLNFGFWRGVFVTRNKVRGSGWETAKLTQTLTQLQQRELIEPHGDGLRFQIELVRRWFMGQG